MRVLLVISLVLLAGLQYRLWVGHGSWANVDALEKELAEQQAVNDKLRARNSVLEAEVNALKNGLDGVEELAREELGLVKKGETFYLLVDEKKN